MDCMTISTFRSLEQQAIRQYKELKAKDTGIKLILRETFGKESSCHNQNNSRVKSTNKPTNEGINYYA